MRIAVVNRSSRKIGGVEVYLDYVIPALADAGHKLALLYECDPIQQRKPISLPTSSPSWKVEELGRGQVLAHLREWRPDICFVHGLRDTALESEIVDCAPSVLYVHNYYGTCISGNKAVVGESIAPCTRKFGASCLIHYFRDRCGGSNPLTMWDLYRRQSHRLRSMRRYRALVGDSLHMVGEMERHGLTAECLYYPLVPPLLSAPPKSATDATLHILFAGRMTHLKGGQHLLAALPQIQARLERKLFVTMAGDGPDRSTWERLAQDSRSDRIYVEFPGWLEGEKLHQAIAKSHLLAYPSLWPEPFGLSGLEAGFLGVPTVAFPVGGIPEWLIENVNGHLAALPAGPATLAEAIIHALSNPHHYDDLCQGARMRSVSYPPDRHLAQLSKIFKRCLS